MCKNTGQFQKGIGIMRFLADYGTEKFDEEMAVIQAVLGHTRDSTTEVYLKNHSHIYKDVDAPMKEIEVYGELVKRHDIYKKLELTTL